MRCWQKTMIWLARNKGLTRAMQGSRWMSGFSRQFVGGRDVSEAVTRALELRERGAAASLFYLGEYVDRPELVERNVQALRELIPALARAGLDAHVSVDPTQVGAMLSWELCRENVTTLARAVAATPGGGRKALMLDMEDSAVTQRTLDLHRHLRAEGLPAAVTVQAYLRRSAQDLAALAAEGAMVRLVKGAFAEAGDIAFTSRADVDAAYRAGIEQLLGAEARKRGVCPVLGTHDHRMVAHAEEVARANGWADDEWEVEMLLGVRPTYQRELVARGRALRLYLPFGEDWWAYSARRVGENPRNLGFVLRSMLSR